MDKITLVNTLTRWAEAVIIIKEDDKAFYGINLLGKEETYPKTCWKIDPTYDIIGGVNRYWQVIK